METCGFQQSESVPPISYRVDSEASRAASCKHNRGGGLASDALVTRGGGWGGFNLFYCTYVSAFSSFLASKKKKKKNLTVINRQQVALFLFLFK